MHQILQLKIDYAEVKCFGWNVRFVNQAQVFCGVYACTQNRFSQIFIFTCSHACLHYVHVMYYMKCTCNSKVISIIISVWFFCQEWTLMSGCFYSGYDNIYWTLKQSFGKKLSMSLPSHHTHNTHCFFFSFIFIFIFILLFINIILLHCHNEFQLHHVILVVLGSLQLFKVSRYNFQYWFSVALITLMGMKLYRDDNIDWYYNYSHI